MNCPGQPPPNYENFNAVELFCPQCRVAMPPRERLHLVLPTASSTNTVARSARPQVGKLKVQGDQAEWLVAPERQAPHVKTKLLALAALALALAAHPLRAQSPTNLRDALLAAQRNWNLPAIAAVIVTSERILDIDAVGVGRLGAPEAVLQSDRFHLGSLTKAMTAMLLATLVEEGKLQWETRVVDAVPEFQGIAHRDMRSVTVEQLLSHRAGLAPFSDLSEFEDLPSWPGSATERRLEFTRYHWSRSADETVGEYLYSNAGYVVAATVAEQITGESWKELMQSRLFEPLGMEAGFDWPALEDRAQPWGHYIVNGRLTPHDPEDDYHVPDLVRPAGDVHASLEDYVLYMQLHLRGLQGRDGFLAPETFQRIHRPIGNYALGWQVDIVDGVPVSTHFGSAGTFYALAAIDPERNLGILVVTNTGHPEARDAVNWAANAIAQIWVDVAASER